MSFSQILKRLRSEKGMTANSLANKLNCHESLIYAWEKERSEPSIEALIHYQRF